MLLSDVHAGESPFKKRPQISVFLHREHRALAYRKRAAAYQRAAALHQRTIAGCGIAPLTSNPTPAYPYPPTSPCARSSLNSQGRSPQAPQSPGGFALTFAGEHTADDRLSRYQTALWQPGRPSSPYTRRLASSAARSLDMHKNLPDAYNKSPMPVYACLLYTSRCV